MSTCVLPPRIIWLLENAEFLCVGTKDVHGNPRVANKFLIKCEESCLYFGDFAKGVTWHSLKTYPRVSIAIMDSDNLIDYQINGEAVLMNPGIDFKELMKVFSEKEIRFSTKRLIESIRKEKGKSIHQLPLPKRIAIWRVDIEEVLELGPSAELKKQQANERLTKDAQ